MSSRKDHIVARNVEGGIMQNNEEKRTWVDTAMSTALFVFFGFISFSIGAQAYVVRTQATIIADQQQTLRECVGVVATVNEQPDFTHDQKHRVIVNLDEPGLQPLLQTN